MKKRRGIVAAISILLVLIVVSLLSQPILDARIKSRIEIAAQKALNVQPSVTLGSGVAAFELLDRKISSFEISTDSYSTPRISKIGLVATFSEVSLPHGNVCAKAGSVVVSASIGASYIAGQVTARFKAKSQIPISKVTIDQGGINVAAGPGGVATIVLIPKASGQNIILSVKTILLFGQPLAPSRVASLTGNFHQVVPVNQVPRYLHLRSVSTSTSGLTLNFKGVNAVLRHGSSCLS